ncbi:hypothetical protein JCM33374_g4322 [Metschnikowia sp. JCM 33374]|nr:hypothetical protein JCM33374_g4322 [Metschnikowia sp. JCM 33374]
MRYGLTARNLIYKEWHGRLYDLWLKKTHVCLYATQSRSTPYTPYKSPKTPKTPKTPKKTRAKPKNALHPNTRINHHVKKQPHTNTSCKNKPTSQPPGPLPMSKPISDARKRQARYDSLKVILASDYNRQMETLDSKTAANNAKPSANHPKPPGGALNPAKFNMDSTSTPRPPNPRESTASRKLTYEALQNYLTKVCTNIMVEEKSNRDPEQVLHAPDFEMVWYEDAKSPPRAYSLKILMTRPFLDRFLTHKMQQVGRKPIFDGQTLMLLAADSSAWYGMVTSSEIDDPVKKTHPRAYAQSKNPKYLKVDVQLFDFNAKPVPPTMDINTLTIIPARRFRRTPNAATPRLSSTVQSILDNPVTIVPRPPGVSSSVATSQVVTELLESGVRPILVTSASNIELDAICHHMMHQHKQSLLRIVSERKEKFYHPHNAVSSVCLHNIVYSGVCQRIKSYMRKMRDPHMSLTWQEYTQMKAAQIPHINRVIAAKDVLLTTPVAAAGPQFKSYTEKPIVVMDDASQSCEVATLIPLLLKGARRIPSKTHNLSPDSSLLELWEKHMTIKCWIPENPAWTRRWEVHHGKAESPPTRRNSRAFAVSAPRNLGRMARRTPDVNEKKLHAPSVNRTPDDDPPPVIVAIAGPPGTGESTLIKWLVRRFTKTPLTEAEGPNTVVSDFSSMGGRYYGLETATMQFWNVAQHHGMPRVLRVATNLDGFKGQSTLPTSKKRLSAVSGQKSTGVPSSSISRGPSTVDIPTVDVEHVPVRVGGVPSV